jgi:radical SAM superfamily enzyme YgiQ (UPF0313 family)
MRKIKVYLADLVHDAVVKGPFTIPLNIGYMASYAKKHLAGEVDISLFKFPLQLMEELKRCPPDILAMSSYSWNTDLDMRMLEYARLLSRDTVTVLGGPNFPICEDEQAGFLAARPMLDFYVVNQGEPGFINLLKSACANRLSRSLIKSAAVDGCVFLAEGSERVVSGERTDSFKELDDIPSPYLDGTLDAFFKEGLIPIIETDRGCPFTCTFCAWGKTTNRDVKQFDIRRVKEEIDYIVGRNTRSTLLFIANANFGIFERDMEIARHLKHCNETRRYPRNISAAWAKNTPKRITEIAELLGDMIDVTISFQSLTPRVLENVQRSNIKTSTFMEIRNYFASKRISSNSETILGLPGETKESYLATLRALFDIDVENIASYNCRMLGGTVLNSLAERKRYGIHTKHRLYDIGFGRYKDMVSIEDDEIVSSTSTMSEEDILYFRPIHWLIQFLWSYKYYITFLKYLSSQGIHPLDFIVDLVYSAPTAGAEVRRLFSDFQADAKGECFDTYEELRSYYSDSRRFEEIMGGGFGKLNYKYTFRVLCDMRDAFDEYLRSVARKMISVKASGCVEASAMAEDIIRYTKDCYVDFDPNMRFVSEKYASYGYDILAWERDNYSAPLLNYRGRQAVRYRFRVSKDQREALESGLRQFAHPDRNVTLRKMSEYIKKSDLFYSVSHCDKKEAAAAA